MTPLEKLKLAAMSDKEISDSDFEKLLNNFKVTDTEQFADLDRILRKYRPQVARKIDNKSFEGGTDEAFAQLRERLVGKSIKDLRREEFGVQFVLTNGDVATFQIEGGKDSLKPKGLLHWFVARVNFREWFRT